MEHPCDKCGQPVDDGIPFCLHFSAPQIRVIIAVPPSQPVSSNLPAIGTSVTIVQNPQGGVGSFPLTRAVRPSALAALLATLAMSLGLVFPAAVLGAGFMAVVFYRRRYPETVIKASEGALLGVISGMICFALSTIILVIAAFVTDLKGQLRESMLKQAARWSPTHSADPQVQAFVESLKTNEGFAVALIFGLLVLFVLCVVLGAGGGAATAAIANRRGRP